jgi:signal transduction histidine kinase
VSRLGCYVRARLRRRLFLWFGAAILLSFLAAGSVMGALNRSTGSSWGREVERVRTFLGGQFAAVWDQPPARDALAQAMARDLEATVILADPEGETVAVFGGDRCVRPWLSAPVVRDGLVLGRLSVCAERPHPSPFQFALPFFAAAVILWALSGAVSRRLTRPLQELARVAGEIGRGEYGARVRLGRHAHGEAAVLADAMNDMAARIERQVTAQRELLAAVSHELRTPLGHVRLLTELIRDGVNVEKSLDDLDREVMEMDALVGDLLASARLDFTALSLQEMDPVEVGRRALSRAGLGEDRLRVEGAPASIEADPTLLGRALANLIDNANKHGGGAIALRVASEPGVVVFEVEDGGRGLGPGEEARIFEPFYRRPDAKAREQGSLGLGLSLVQRIAEAHGGRARASNRPEGGARIGLSLPALG